MPEIKLEDTRTTYTKVIKRYTIKVGDVAMEYWKMWMDDEAYGDTDNDEGWETDADEQKYKALADDVQDEVMDFISELN